LIGPCHAFLHLEYMTIGQRIALIPLRWLVNFLIWLQPNRVKPGSVEYFKSAHGRKCRIDVYPPSQKVEKDSLLPIHINLQGAGFCLYGRSADSQFCQQLADAAPCVVLDLDYSKAPEAPWPAAIEDTEALIEWLLVEGRGRGWDPSRISLGGFSSGGCIALVVASQAKGQHLRCVSAFYPSTNLSQDAADKPNVKQGSDSAGEEMPAFMRSFLYRCYVPVGQDKTDPRLSPFFASPAAFPPSITIVSLSGDRLGQESKDLAIKLQEAGKDCVLFECEGQGHAFDKSRLKKGSKPAELREEMYQLVVDRTKSAFAQGS